MEAMRTTQQKANLTEPKTSIGDTESLSTCVPVQAEQRAVFSSGSRDASFPGPARSSRDGDRRSQNHELIFLWGNTLLCGITVLVVRKSLKTAFSVQKSPVCWVEL